MVLLYPVIFTATHDKKDTYLVYIPDLDGMTEGRGLKDSFRMARDYMGCTLYQKKDELIPKARTLSEAKVSMSPFYKKEKAKDSFVSLVDFDLDAYRKMMNKKSVRRNVSIPAWLDQAAEEAHINVSRVLQEALMEKLNL